MTTKEGKEILELLKQMHPDAGCELHFGSVFELLVAVILSAQCTDKRVNAITDELFKVYNKPEQFASMTLEELKPYIFSCGFFNNKGKNIIEASKIIAEKYGGEVPRNFDELVALPGVGRKTASVVTCVGFNEPAMPVDTHVFRVARRLGLSVGNTPERVEEDLKRIFMKEEWNAAHHAMIFHGRYICDSRKPKCDECLLKSVCRYEKNI